MYIKKKCCFFVCFYHTQRNIIKYIIFFKISLFVFQKKVTLVWNAMRASKRWQNLICIFWLLYHANKCGRHQKLFDHSVKVCTARVHFDPVLHLACNAQECVPGTCLQLSAILISWLQANQLHHKKRTNMRSVCYHLSISVHAVNNWKSKGGKEKHPSAHTKPRT